MQNSPTNNEYIYGINPVFEVIRAQKRKIDNILVNQKQQNSPRLKKLIALVEKNGIPLKYIDKGKLINLTGSKEHQGCAAAVSAYKYTNLNTILKSEKLLLLDNIEDPQNLGAILRSAEIFGFNAVLLPQKGVPGIYPSVVKASAGATEHLQINQSMNANDYFNTVKENGFKTIALDTKGEISLKGIAEKCQNSKFMLIIGGENISVGQFILNNADFIAKIPQTGKINSLNASVAAGIAMYEFLG